MVAIKTSSFKLIGFKHFLNLIINFYKYISDDITKIFSKVMFLEMDNFISELRELKYYIQNSNDEEFKNFDFDYVDDIFDNYAEEFKKLIDKTDGEKALNREFFMKLDNIYTLILQIQTELDF